MLDRRTFGKLPVPSMAGFASVRLKSLVHGQTFLVVFLFDYACLFNSQPFIISSPRSQLVTYVLLVYNLRSPLRIATFNHRAVGQQAATEHGIVSLSTSGMVQDQTFNGISASKLWSPYLLHCSGGRSKVSETLLIVRDPSDITSAAVNEPKIPLISRKSAPPMIHAPSTSAVRDATKSLTARMLAG
nr:hypothetical protein CFP56_11124 [Quercus suber]